MLKTAYILTALLFIWFAEAVSAQSFEPFQVRYYYLFKSKVHDAQSDQYLPVEREGAHLFAAMLRYPLKVGKTGMWLLPAIQYKHYMQSFRQWPTIESEPGNIRHYGFYLNGLVPVNKRWSIIFTAGLDQGLNEGTKWDHHTYFYRVGVGFLLKTDSTTTLGLSLVYSQVLNIPIPIIIYRTHFRNRQWVVDFALPRYGKIDYQLSPTTVLRAQEQLIASRFLLADHPIGQATTSNTTQVNFTLGILQRILGPLHLGVDGGFTVRNRLAFFDADKEALERLRLRWQPLLSASLSVVLQSKNKE